MQLKPTTKPPKRWGSTILESEIDRLEQSCRRALAWAEEWDYEGYSKYDALDSFLLRALSLGNKYLRLIYTQVVMRSPVNLRPWLLVPKGKNPKGMALFAQAYLNLFAYRGDDRNRDQALYCLNWLRENQASGYSGACWGYNSAWQTPGFYAPKFGPNMVVTAFVSRAFVKAYELLGNEAFLDLARSSVEFIRRDLRVVHESKEMKCYSYTPFARWTALNINALGAGLLARIYHHTREPSLRDEAQRMMEFVVSKQTDYGAWYYTDPPNLSPLTHDNYHTGYILDSILEYSYSTGDQSYMANYRQGLEFYDQNLFLNNEAPKFLFDRIYPIDIHGAAQGIVTFSKAAQYGESDMRKALKIAKWAIDNMQDSDGHFYYQKGRLFTKKFSLVRWNQAWMAYALTTLLASLQQVEASL